MPQETPTNFFLSSVVSRPRLTLVLVLAGLMPVLGGCGKSDGLHRLPVHGTVTVGAGEELNGSITFWPSRGGSGPSATIAVVGGHYSFDRNNGPTVGPHNVKVTRLIHRNEQLAAIAQKKPLPPSKTWEDTADLADDGKCVYNFTWKD